MRALFGELFRSVHEKQSQCLLTYYLINRGKVYVLDSLRPNVRLAWCHRRGGRAPGEQDKDGAPCIRDGDYSPRRDDEWPLFPTADSYSTPSISW